MTDPLPTSACPDCGAPLPPESPQSLCPACLMRQALASRTVALDGDKTPQLPPLSPEEIADRFPGYEILECLGRGGMGAVYKARQKSLNRLVAIKILAPERVGEGRFAERFTIEAELLAKLGHPHIVTIHDFGETGGLFYLVMEFIDGVNLRDLLRDGKLEAQQALAIVPPICDALQYAHDKGIVHRDIKPENILLDRDGRVKIADFGIASLVGATGENSGTPPYMAPEQSGGTVDRRADIYALGVVLYEMLTGERPEKDLVAPSRKVSIDVRIDEIVLQALEKNPERRYQQASVMKTRLETIAEPEKASAKLLDKALRWFIHLVWAACVSGLVTLAITFVSEILTKDRGHLDQIPMTWEDVYGPVIMVLLGGGLLTIPVRSFRFSQNMDRRCFRGSGHHRHRIRPGRAGGRSQFSFYEFHRGNRDLCLRNIPVRIRRSFRKRERPLSALYWAFVEAGFEKVDMVSRGMFPGRYPLGVSEKFGHILSIVLLELPVRGAGHGSHRVQIQASRFPQRQRCFVCCEKVGGHPVDSKFRQCDHVDRWAIAPGQITGKRFASGCSDGDGHHLIGWH